MSTSALSCVMIFFIFFVIVINCVVETIEDLLIDTREVGGGKGGGRMQGVGGGREGGKGGGRHLYPSCCRI